MMSSCIVISQHDVILIDWVFKCVHKAIIEVMNPLNLTHKCETFTLMPSLDAMSIALGQSPCFQVLHVT